MAKRGRFSRNKKAVATEILMESAQLVIAMIVLIGSLTYVNNRLEKVGFAQTFYARDAGLLLTTIHSAPGNVFYLYSVEDVDEDDPGKYRFQFQISNNTIKVNATGSKKQNLYWYFSDSATQPIQYDESGILGLFIFSKTGNTIEVGKVGTGIKINANKILCPDINTREAAWLQKKIIIDPAHHEFDGDTGALSTRDLSFYESDITYRIGLRTAGVSEQNRMLTRGSAEYVSLNERAEKAADFNPDLIISIHTGDYIVQKNYIKAYYNVNSDESTRIKSRKLGCRILNSILDYPRLDRRERINGVAVIPSDSEYVQKILPEGKIGVLVELGNIQIPRNENFLADLTNLAEAINMGIGNYYEK